MAKWVKKYGAWDHARLIAALDHTMANQWQGIVEERLPAYPGKPLGQNGKTSGRPGTPADLDEIARMKGFQNHEHYMANKEAES
jgi:hypothetical protein